MNDRRASDVEALAHLMDTILKVPGLNLRVGLDPLLGLIPGVGDTVSSLISMYIIVAAARYGLPRVTLLRMGMNVVIDTLLGSLPLVGDLFDVYWKSNTRNVDLLRRHLEAVPAAQRRVRRGDWVFVVGILLAILLALAASIVVVVWVISRLIG